jgi:hypothetical protein
LPSKAFIEVAEILKDDPPKRRGGLYVRTIRSRGTYNQSFLDVEISAFNPAKQEKSHRAFLAKQVFVGR